MPRPVQGQQQGASRAQPSKQQQRRQQQQTHVADGEDEFADELRDSDDDGSSEDDFQPSKKPRGT
jgi:hypothetical protein